MRGSGCGDCGGGPRWLLRVVLRRQRLLDQRRHRCPQGGRGVCQEAGSAPLPPVTCLDSLDKKVGATTHCFAKGKFNGKTKTLGITAKVTSKHGSHYGLDFQTTGFEK